MRTRWLVAADEYRARIFARVDGLAQWQDIVNLTRAHPKRQQPGREVRLPELQRQNSIEHDDFALRLASDLGAARKRGDFDELILVAQEPFLTRLKDALDAATRRKLKHTEALELTGMPLPDARREISRRW